MNARSIRYEIHQIRTDGSLDLIQANSRKLDAIKRAKFVVTDTIGWPRTVGIRVMDARTGFCLFCAYR